MEPGSDHKDNYFFNPSGVGYNSAAGPDRPAGAGYNKAAGPGNPAGAGYSGVSGSGNPAGAGYSGVSGSGKPAGAGYRGAPGAAYGGGYHNPSGAGYHGAAGAVAPQAQVIAVPTVRAALQAQVIWILRRAHRQVSRLKSREPAIKKKFLYI